jgi:hypothetical protein
MSPKTKPTPSQIRAILTEREAAFSQRDATLAMKYWWLIRK